MADARNDTGAVGDEVWTCGKGLAAHAAIPGRVADFLGALADTLAGHVPTIDTAHPAGCRERDAYVDLARDYAAIAARLKAAAERMRGYHDLPPAPHHEAALADPALLDLFAKFVALETDLASLLASSARSDAELLEHFRSPDA